MYNFTHRSIKIITNTVNCDVIVYLKILASKFWVRSRPAVWVDPQTFSRVSVDQNLLSRPK